MTPRNIYCYQIDVTSGANGAGTATTRPISGQVVEVRIPNAGTALFSGGTADLTITRQNDGGTVVGAANITIPFTISPRQIMQPVAGGGTALLDPNGVPVDSGLNVVVADGLASKTTTVYIYYRT